MIAVFLLHGPVIATAAIVIALSFGNATTTTTTTATTTTAAVLETKVRDRFCGQWDIQTRFT